MPRARGVRIPFVKLHKPTNPLSSSLLLAFGFGALIILGAFLLMLPISSRTGDFTSPVNAFFTATSAVSVTGLAVVDTGTYWSTFGQGVLLALFQIGGLGFIAGATLLLLAVNRHFGLKERLAITEATGVDGLGGTLGLVIKIAIFSLVVEAAGAIVFYFHWLNDGNPETSLWTAIFHAVSAFNNCGMDLLGNFKSLSGYEGDTVFLLVTALLVVIGSIGYIVVMNVLKTRSFFRLTLESKVVLITTLTLLVLGMIFILGVEYSNSATLGELPGPQKALVAFFQAVTPRTAGFTVIDIGGLKQITLFFIMVLMFIGGAVGSTAGGIKVNTLGVLMLTLRSLLRGRSSVEAFDRQIAQETIYRAIALFLLFLGAASIIVLLLSITETFPIDKVLFEAFSAITTTGLSTGITPDLSTPGRIIIIAAMFIGRLGPLALMAFLIHRRRPAEVEYPYENIRLG
jgi:trk system potassium uptake protein